MSSRASFGVGAKVSNQSLVALGVGAYVGFGSFFAIAAYELNSCFGGEYAKSGDGGGVGAGLGGKVGAGVGTGVGAMLPLHVTFSPFALENTPCLEIDLCTRSMRLIVCHARTTQKHKPR